MSIPGGKSVVIGTNPLAYAVPAGKERPLLFDIATSAVAATKIFIAQEKGEQVPPGWLIDKDGRPTTDPSGYPNGKSLLPMAGHKGYGLALLIEVLTGALSGGAVLNEIASWVFNDNRGNNQSVAFIAMDINTIRPIAEFKKTMDMMIRSLKDSPKAVGNAEIFLPGEKEWRNREAALERGISYPEYVMKNIRGVAGDYGLDMKKVECP
jgi:ureidoglycolate dehydrogenase (NAD+)